MLNNGNDITHLKIYWQKFIAIDPDFKDIHIPPDSAGKKLQEFWYKNKFNSAYEWAKSVKEFAATSSQVKAKKLIKLVDTMKEKGIL